MSSELNYRVVSQPLVARSQYHASHFKTSAASVKCFFVLDVVEGVDITK